MNTNEIINIQTGYAMVKDDKYVAKGTITLIKGCKNILVDTGSPCREDQMTLKQGLTQNGLSPEDIDVVVCTHGHVDHVGNLNMFPEAKFVVGNDISQGDHYLDNNLNKGEAYPLSDDIEVIPTPGHMCHDVTLKVQNTSYGVVAVAGDLFESEADLKDAALWRDNSHNPELQNANRQKVLAMADFIIPGHGSGFIVKPEYRLLSTS